MCFSRIDAAQRFAFLSNDWYSAVVVIGVMNGKVYVNDWYSAVVVIGVMNGKVYVNDWYSAVVVIGVMNGKVYVNVLLTFYSILECADFW